MHFLSQELLQELAHVFLSEFEVFNFRGQEFDLVVIRETFPVSWLKLWQRVTLMIDLPFALVEDIILLILFEKQDK